VSAKDFAGGEGARVIAAAARKGHHHQDRDAAEKLKSSLKT